MRQILVLLLVLPLLVFSCKKKDIVTSPVAVNGVIDLRDWDFEKDGEVNLDGEWEFITYHSLNSISDHPETKKNYISIPMNKNQPGDDEKFFGPKDGLLRIKVLKNRDQTLTIDTKPISFPFEIYWKDKEKKQDQNFTSIYSNKNFSDNIHFIGREEGIFEISILLPNSYIETIQKFRVPAIGSKSSLDRKRSRSIFINFFIFGGLLSISFYHFILYYLRRNEISVLYFSIFSFSLGFRELFISGQYRLMILPSSNPGSDNPEVQIFFLSLLFLLTYFLIKYFNQLITQIRQFALWGIASFVFLLLFLPDDYLVKSNLFFYILSMALLLIITVVLVKAGIKKTPGVRTSILGFLVWIGLEGIDKLFPEVFFELRYLSSLGCIGFILSQTHLVIVEFSNEFRDQIILKYIANSKKDEVIRAKLEIEKLNNSKDIFFENVSHQVKTPLSQVYKTSQLLFTSEISDQVRFYNEEIYENAGRLNDYLQDLMMIIGLDTYSNLNIQELNLKQLVDEIVNTYHFEYTDKRIQILNKISPEVFVKSDKLLFSKILNHLIKNAFMYNKYDGQIEIITKIDEEKFLLEISDTGIGIEEEYQKKVFQKFYRVDLSGSSENPGLGVGLYLTKEITKLLGYEIQLISKFGMGTKLILSKDYTNALNEESR